MEDDRPQITGHVAEGFEPVLGVFEQLVDDRAEDAGQVCALVDGEPVVDLRAGLAADALVNTYSVVKPFVAFCALILVDRGQLRLDQRIADVWPEYGRHGKERTTLRHVLAHQAGVPALANPPPADVLFDWDAMCERIADEPPHWEPGVDHGEHALTYGHLVGEVIRRTDGRDLKTFWREEVAEPWVLDFHIGVPDSELHRVHDLTDPNGSWARHMRQNDRWRPVLDSPPGALHLDVVNGTAWRRAQIPAVNGHGNAKAIARFYAGLTNGGTLDGAQLVDPSTVTTMLTPQATGLDRITGEHITWGLGVWLEDRGDFGMGGVGGSLGFGHCAERLAYAYVTARVGDHERTVRVEEPLRARLR